MLVRAAAASYAVRSVARVAGVRRAFSAAVLMRQKRGDDDGAHPTQFVDPFPLPFSRELDPRLKAEGVNLASEGQRIDDIVVPIRVPNREGEERPKKLARLQYQCRKRGTLETDLILSTFALKELPSLSDAELDELDRLLDEPDWDIFYWCTDRKPVPPAWKESFATEGRLGHRLRLHTRNDERAVRRFPELSSEIKSPA
ncbi:Succinate dehydrogenase assembly factor 2 mitochondrial [Malassezia brasiliensis]|uniref:Succinate dehydrogenase assembly factor 2, mitochondrial n=1 Tax=Malassezia brasiliensis TaxID=1821822 RepID=A0AAF0DVQ8_9BASI|nr:Succinate dehydrogenase assembly factor 2 mitochondrial [Malassezia brasiliensis]